MHDAQIRVAIAGAGGRMGRQLIQAALQMDGVALGAALEREGSSLLGAMPVSWRARARPASPCKAAWRR
jgi:dihydrodipicolinate reductase